MIVVEGGVRYIDKRPRRVGDPRPPDRRRPDDLRPAAPRLSVGRSVAAARRRSSSRPGASTRMGGIDKLTAPIGGRPLLAWTLAAFAASPRVERIVVVTPADRPSVRGRAAGCRRARRSSPAARAARSPSRPAFARARRLGRRRHDRRRPRPRRRAARRRSGARRARSSRRPPSTAPRSRSCPSPRRSSASTAASSPATVDRDGLGAAQTPQGVRLGLLRAAYAPLPAGRTGEFTDEAALLEACTIPVHAVPGDPTTSR